MVNDVFSVDFIQDTNIIIEITSVKCSVNFDKLYIFADELDSSVLHKRSLQNSYS